MTWKLPHPFTDRLAGLLLAGMLGLAAAPAASETVTPLFTHPDQGPIAVRHGDSGERLPLEDARAEVRAFIADANALIAEDDAATTDTIERALSQGRELEKQLDTKLVGTLYLEEGVRRLQRIRLNRIPVTETNVFARYAERYAERFDKAVVLRRAVDDLGISYGTLAACLELADFPNDEGPREVTVEDDGAIWARVAGAPLAFDIVAFRDQRMLVRSIVLGATRSLGFKDKAQLTRFLLESCI